MFNPLKLGYNTYKCELQKSIKPIPRFCVLIPMELNEYSYARFNKIENTNKYLVSKFANRLASTLSNRDKNRLKYKYSLVPKVFVHVKKSLYYQPKPYFFKKLL